MIFVRVALGQWNTFLWRPELSNTYKRDPSSEEPVLSLPKEGWRALLVFTYKPYYSLKKRWQNYSANYNSLMKRVFPALRDTAPPSCTY